ncbi:MAG: nucleoside-diphosphate kinase [Anaplasmataceae bacterium]|nr:nucleoside-diphosphate kinase [Anaplasmataceae bacterium]
MTSKTLCIIKPDAVKNKLVDKINTDYLLKQGLKIVNKKQLQLTDEQAKAFYAVHSERGFFGELIEFMTSGEVVVQLLEHEGDDAITLYRNIMGATNPKEADKGTIRGDLAESIDANCVHGSDSAENAEIEIKFFFPENV